MRRAVSTTLASIRFAQGAFADLRARLLDDLSQEAFAVLLGKRETVGNRCIVKVIEAKYPTARDYKRRGIAHLSLEKDFVFDALAELMSRLDADTLIDVHTHPFCPSGVAFSSTDDRDEERFSQFLLERFEGVHFGSIVLSQADYAARFWERGKKAPQAVGAGVRTQTSLEAWPDSGHRANTAGPSAGQGLDEQFLARSILALGVDTLRRIAAGQAVAIVGVGGLGSIIAENLIHMGFQNLHLIDPDHLEVTNLNRVVGAYYEDAIQQRPKVEVVRDHLTRIHPGAQVFAHQKDVHDAALEAVLADADWIVAATDNHASRARAQELALRYAVPLISVGVNITVSGGAVTDMSGEVITVRAGDGLCLSCLGRLDPVRIAAERDPDGEIGQQLVARGYVTGANVKQPAVKTLNAALAALAVDVLVNQYTGRQVHSPILVLENNQVPAIYADHQSLGDRVKHCFTCG